MWREEGIVFVWGAAPETLADLNALLPIPLALSPRKASSLVPAAASPLVAGFEAADLYFCDQHPPEITSFTLGGTLIERGMALLKACDTDWLKWNNQPEYAKTAMVLRSERESKPSGVVLAEVSVGHGKLIVATLPADPRTLKSEKMVRQVLQNLGLRLKPGMDAGKPLLRTGALVRTLACGFLPASKPDEANSLWRGNTFRAQAQMQGRLWTPVFAESGTFDLTQLKLAGSVDDAELYLSFWISSPRSLEDLLPEPDLPQVDLETQHHGVVQVWLNEKPLAPAEAHSGHSQFAALKLHAGWNHLLMHVVHNEGSWDLSARLASNHPEFLAQLDSALEAPGPS